jgi:hypothetical protein
MSITTGLLWAGFMARAREGRLTRWMAAAVVTQAVIVALGTWQGSHLLGVRNRWVRAREATVSATFKENSGIILCPYSGMEVGGKAESYTTDIFKLSQLTDAGIFPKEELLRSIRERELSVIIMPSNPEYGTLFGQDVKEVVQKNYRLVSEPGKNLYYTAKPTRES